MQKYNAKYSGQMQYTVYSFLAFNIKRTCHDGARAIWFSATSFGNLGASAKLLYVEPA